MAELKVYLPDELDERFRKLAMTVHGFGKGSLSKAAAEAILQWCMEKDRSLTQGSAPTEGKPGTVADKRELPKEPDRPNAQTDPSRPSTANAAGT